jgi:type II secretory pathway pseudopilin PulG
MFAKSEAQAPLAFTLLELLLVVGIVALLASLLLPSLARAKEASRGLKCMGNLQQFSYAWVLYADDNNDILVANNGATFGAEPWVRGFLTPGDLVDSWPDNTNTVFFQKSPLARYLGSALKLWRCPSDRSQALENGQWLPRVRSYSMNVWLDGGYAPGEDQGALKMNIRMSDLVSPPPIWYNRPHRRA